MKPIDIKKARLETRASTDLIHFNNAGAALMPRPVVEAVIQYLRDEESFGGYETADKYRTELQGFYTAAAKLLGCQAEEIAFIENATRAWDMAFYSFKFKTGDRILTSESEYSSNLLACFQRAKQTGAVVEYIPSDASGQLDVQALQQMIDDKVQLIAINHIPTGSGLVNPAAEVGRIANAAGIPYLLDACQSVGQLPVNVQQLGCDMLSATGRKFLRGPRGTGFLYVKKSLIEKLEPPFLDLHAAKLFENGEYEIRKDAKRFENWESNLAGKYGLAVAINYALQWELEPIYERVQFLAQRLRAGLAVLPGIKLHDAGHELCGIVTFELSQHSAVEVKSYLAEHKVNVSIASMQGGSGPWYARRGLGDLLRASVHYYNSEAEVDQFLALLKDYR